MEPPMAPARRAAARQNEIPGNRSNGTHSNFRKRTNSLDDQLNSSVTLAPSAQSKRAIVLTSTEWKSRSDKTGPRHMGLSKPGVRGRQTAQKVSEPPPKPPVGRKANAHSRVTAKRGGKLTKGPHQGAHTDKNGDTRIKGPWTKDEDALLSQLVKEFGPKKWSIIASHVPGRIGKQCRERWLNHLDSNVKKTAWTEEEDNVLLQEQDRVGNRWCEISKLLPGRPENAVKNRWNSLMNRRYAQKPYKDHNQNNLASHKMSGNLGRSMHTPHQPASIGGQAAVAALNTQNQRDGYYNDAMNPRYPNQRQAYQHSTNNPPPQRLTSRQQQLQRKNEAVADSEMLSNIDQLLQSTDTPTSMDSYTMNSSEGWLSSLTPTGENGMGYSYPKEKNEITDKYILDMLDPSALNYEPLPFNQNEMGQPSSASFDPLADLDLDVDSSMKRPSITSFGGDPLSASLTQLSLDVSIRNLMDMPMESTPRSVGQNGMFSPTNATQAALSRSNQSFMNSPAKCLSPAAIKLEEVNGFFKEGQIDANEKSKLKTQILRESMNGTSPMPSQQ